MFISLFQFRQKLNRISYNTYLATADAFNTSRSAKVKPRHHYHKHANRFRLFRFRSPLLSESLLFSFPLGTEMFHFPRCAHHNLCIQLCVFVIKQRSFLIRISPDQRLFATSPKLNAGYYVLHRSLMPRHPPYTILFNHKNNKLIFAMLLT